MELGISSQDMIRHKEIGVSHVFHGLDKRTYRAGVCTELRLGENSAYFHDASPLLMAFCHYHTLWQEIAVESRREACNSHMRLPWLCTFCRCNPRIKRLCLGESWRCFALTQRQNEQGPRLLIEAAHCRAGATHGQWLAAWRMHNLGREPVVILSTWLPHDKFANPPQDIDPPVRLAPGGSTVLELPVACNELPGSVVENAFVILRLLWFGQLWRAFVRLRVTVDDSRIPQSRCESITVHPAGFSSHRGANQSSGG